MHEVADIISRVAACRRIGEAGCGGGTIDTEQLTTAGGIRGSQGHPGHAGVLANSPLWRQGLFVTHFMSLLVECFLIMGKLRSAMSLA